MDDSDIYDIGQDFIELLENGLSIDMAKANMMLTDKMFTAIEEMFPQIKILIHKAPAREYLEMYELTRMGSAPSSMYIHRAKTIWRRWYPQEDETINEDRIKQSADAIIDVINKRSM